jgi:hypothetical protein
MSKPPTPANRLTAVSISPPNAVLGSGDKLGRVPRLPLEKRLDILELLNLLLLENPSR